MIISTMYQFCLILVCALHVAFAKPEAVEQRGYGCYYENQWYAQGTTVWQDPECECTRLICNHNKVELVEKEKPCCYWDGMIFGNGETMMSSMCQDTICKDGKYVSLPRCPCNFMPISYKDCVGCYNVSSYEMTFDEAWKYCKSIGGRLAEVTSKAEDKALEWFLSEKFYKKGMKYFWLGGKAEMKWYNHPSDPNMSKHYLSPFYWKSLKYEYQVMTPVESIYCDWCNSQPSKDPEKTALQLGYYDYGQYCWCNQKPEKMNYAICETCTAEKQYTTYCMGKDGKMFSNMEIMKMETDYPGPCYKKICYNGRYVKKSIPCKTKLYPIPGTTPKYIPA